MENQSLPIALASLFGLASLLAKEGRNQTATRDVGQDLRASCQRERTREQSTRLLAELKSQLISPQMVRSAVQNTLLETILETLLSDGIEQYLADQGSMTNA